MGYMCLSGITFVLGTWSLVIVLLAVCYEHKDDIAHQLCIQSTVAVNKDPAYASNNAMISHGGAEHA